MLLSSHFQVTLLIQHFTKTTLPYITHTNQAHSMHCDILLQLHLCFFQLGGISRGGPSWDDGDSLTCEYFVGRVITPHTTQEIFINGVKNCEENESAWKEARMLFTPSIYFVLVVWRRRCAAARGPVYVYALDRISSLLLNVFYKMVVFFSLLLTSWLLLTCKPYLVCEGVTGVFNQQITCVLFVSTSCQKYYIRMHMWAIQSPLNSVVLTAIELIKIFTLYFWTRQVNINHRVIS